jgi:hypothetical protein
LKEFLVCRRILVSALPSSLRRIVERVSGLSEGELARVRGRLVEFAGEMFESMARKDQRRWGEVYLRGLMLDGKRKSIEPMAARLADGDEQCLQQFVNQSPWDPILVRRALAVRMSTELCPAAWVIDDTGFPKFGRMSVGVARQYSGALGKVGNCQIGVSINAVTDEASCAIGWRLFIPKEWDELSEANVDRRARCRLPDEVHHMEKWRQALVMIDELRSWGITPPATKGMAAPTQASRRPALRAVTLCRQSSTLMSQSSSGNTAVPGCCRLTSVETLPAGVQPGDDADGRHRRADVPANERHRLRSSAVIG